MQTFMSEPHLYDCAAVLDDKRLNKQYLEGWQILNAIAQTPEGGGQRVNGKIPFASNHPATNQWRGHEYALSGYLACVEAELNIRGIKTVTIMEKIQQTMKENGWFQQLSGLPSWWKDTSEFERLRITHRGNLYNKDPEHYAQYEADAVALDRDLESLVCCPGKHAPYYYPTH
jgi:hypothetical protein